MADVSIGTFEVMSMAQMTTATPPSVPTQLPGPPGGEQLPVAAPPSYTLTMRQTDPPEGAGPGSINIVVSAGPVAVHFVITDVHLGMKYEVILREVV
jgi:hypothetical protein